MRFIVYPANILDGSQLSNCKYFKSKSTENQTEWVYNLSYFICVDLAHYSLARFNVTCAIACSVYIYSYVCIYLARPLSFFQLEYYIILLDFMCYFVPYSHKNNMRWKQSECINILLKRQHFTFKLRDNIYL